MNKYKLHQHVPPWICAMDGELLSSAELDVLDFIHWCKRYGCRTSNDSIGQRTHHSHATVQRAILKLHRLELITIGNYATRNRSIKAVAWADRETWDFYTRLRGSAGTQAAHDAPHIPIQDRLTLKGESCIGSKETPATGAPTPPVGQAPPKTPRGSKEHAQKAYHLSAKLHRDRIQSAGRTREHANQIALVKYPGANLS